MSGPVHPPSASNLLGLDYRAEAARFPRMEQPTIDVHTHVNGTRAAQVYGRAMDLYGVGLTLSQTQIGQAAAVREVLGERIRFIAMPSYMDRDKGRTHREGFLENIRRFHGEFGARIVKLWAAPRLVDMREQIGGPDDVVGLDSPWRLKAAELAQDLGMMFMVHVADPDTWFATKYADASVYGTKRDQYVPLERMLRRFDAPWIAAHMGGWPEDLDFLDGLLTRHSNLYLDTSATKWMVRELSRHPRQRLREFMHRWRGRILFGSDIVTMDEHLAPSSGDDAFPVAALADSESAAFDLYAGRYWALRTLWETGYDGPGPIADPDLHMVAPDRHAPTDSPPLRGVALPDESLRPLYHDAAADLIARYGI